MNAATNAAPDYYRLLRVSPDAPIDAIRTSYRALLETLSERDVEGLRTANARALLAEAFDVLSDPERRAAYDRERDQVGNPDDFAATTVLEPDVERYAANRCLFCGSPHGIDRAPAPDDDCRTCASPLYPAARQRLDYSGQRMLARIPKKRDVDLYVSWPQKTPFPAEMRDLSLNGMQIGAGAPLQINQVVKIDGETCAAVARVAHCQPEGGSVLAERWTVGVEFLTLRFRNPRGTFVSARA